MYYTTNILKLRHIVIVISLLMLLPLSRVWSTPLFDLFGQSGQPDREPVPISLTLSGQTTWNKKGGGDAIIDLQMTYTGLESCTGELRLILFGINGRIDFDAVSIKVLDRPAQAANTDQTQQNVYTSFFVEKAVTLGKASQHWRFKMTLPAGSRQPNMALQLFALYRGKIPSGETWVSRDALILAQPKK